LQRKRGNQKERHIRCRERAKVITREVTNIASFIHIKPGDENIVHVKKVYAFVNRIACFINSKLSCLLIMNSTKGQ